MRNINRIRFAIAIIASLLMIVGFGAKRASAIPAFADRLGVPCSTCHEPIFPRLNRTGWEFRQLGYRTRSEMNQDISPFASPPPAADGTPGKPYGVPISIEIRLDYDNLQRDGYRQFSDGYVKAVSVYFAGPASTNFGYWGEAQFPQQAEQANSKTHTYTLVGPSTSGAGAELNPWLRGYYGKPGNFFYTRLGNVSVDGFEGNNSSLMAATSASTLTTGVNGSFISGRGGEFGYNRKDDAVAAYVIEPSGDGYEKNAPSTVLQYLHFIGKHDSSVQLLYLDGNVPISTSVGTGDIAVNGWNKVSQGFIYANYRQPILKGQAVNVLGGYTVGQNHNTVVQGTGATAITVAGSSFNTSGYFGEFDYEHGKFVPYVRYDNLHTGNYLAAGTAKNGNADAITAGTAISIDKYAKLNIDDNFAHSSANGKFSTFRMQLQFIF